MDFKENLKVLKGDFSCSVEEAMDTQPAPVKPVVVVNRQDEPVAVEAPAIPPPSEPNLAKPPPVNRARTKAKSEDIGASDPTIPPVKAEPASITAISQKEKAKSRKQKMGKGHGPAYKRQRVKSLFS